MKRVGSGNVWKCSLALLTAAGLLGCANGVSAPRLIAFGDPATVEREPWDPARLEGYRVYYQGESARPSAVVLDDATDQVRFNRAGWIDADGPAAARVVTAAAGERMKAAPLTDRDGDRLGYVLAATGGHPFRESFYGLLLETDVPPRTAYRVIHHEIPSLGGNAR